MGKSKSESNKRKRTSTGSSNHAVSVNTVDMAMQTSPQLINDIKSPDNIGSVLNQVNDILVGNNVFPEQSHNLRTLPVQTNTQPPPPPVYGLSNGVSPNMRGEFMDINRQYIVRSPTPIQMMSALTPQLHQVHQVFNPQPQSFGSRTDTRASPENVPELASNSAAVQFVNSPPSIIAEMNNKLSKLELLDGIHERLGLNDQKFVVLQNEISGLKTEINKCKADNKENRDRIDGNEFNYAELEERVCNIEQDNEDILDENKKLKERIIDLQTRSMRENLVFSRIPEQFSTDERGNRFEETENVLKDFLEKEMQIDSVKVKDKHSSLHFKLEVNINCPKNNKNTNSQQIVRWNPDKTEEFVNSFDINVVKDLISSLDTLCCNSKTNQDNILEDRINDIVNHLGHLFTQSADCVMG
ncbi:hypothetical protein KUTeg_005284 [Tegillarca granosa]|uniref:Uncharacterized protein n=1 Tax=Tegillarca granosa TaxID=220873 RepID=A0ABQ9FM76_TEGGR|nr:hypothetical protein KUTeg_005284 [Tegillarca granosa]